VVFSARKCVIAAFLGTLLTAPNVLAEPGSYSETLKNPPPQWLDQQFPYHIVDQALPDALSALGHALDVRIDFSPELDGRAALDGRAGVDGRLRNYRHRGTAGDFLRYLETDHRLDWIIDQDRLFLSTADERTQRSWPLGASSIEAIKAALTRAGLTDPRFPLRIDAGRSEMHLTGPPHYLAVAAPIIQRQLAPARTRTVTVIHGRSRTGGT